MNVKEARLLLGESQAAFGRRLGVDQATVHRWERYGIPEQGTAKVAIERLLQDIERIHETTRPVTSKD